MKNLPPCKFRSKEVTEGRWECTNYSCFPFISPQEVTARTCFKCSDKGFADRTCNPDIQRLVEPPKPPDPNSPGSMFKILIHTITGQEPTGNCSCNSRARQLDLWGWKGSIEHRNEIAAWLAEESGRLGIQVEPNLKALAAQAAKMMQEKGVTIDMDAFGPLGKAMDDDEELAAKVQALWGELGLEELFKISDETDKMNAS